MNARRIVSVLLIVSGLALCLYAARHYYRGWRAQSRALEAFEAHAHGKPGGAPLHAGENPGVGRAAAGPGADEREAAGPEGVPAGYPYGEPIARIRIPAASIDAIVFAGADAEVLEKGPGHVPGTELPGASTGRHNCVITGHRDSHFRHLGWIREGARVDLEAAHRTRRYRVVSREIVSPDAVRVLEPTDSDRLTLITCYPFNVIGPAPQRLVVVAEAEGPAARR